MNISLQPALAKFIDEQVESGRFSSRSQAVEAGVARLMADTDLDILDEKDINDIRISTEQMRRHQTISGKSLHARLRKKHLQK